MKKKVNLILFLISCTLIWNNCSLENLHEDLEMMEVSCDVVADFTVTNDGCRAPCMVSFNNASLNATSFTWDFGDGNTSNSNSPNHFYATPGDYTVSLIASDTNCQTTISKSISIQSLTFELTFGTSIIEIGQSVKQTNDNGYILAGYKKNSIVNNNSEDAYIVKVNQSGVQEWSETIGGAIVAPDRAHDIIQDSNGNYAYTGFNDSFEEEDGDEDGDMAFIRLNQTGNILQNRHFGLERNQIGYSIRQTSDGGFILGGTSMTFSNGDLDAYIVKVDPLTGSYEWRKSFGGDFNDSVAAIRQTPDGGYVSVGFTNSFGSGSSDIYLLKINSEGIKEWSRTFGSAMADRGNDLILTSDGGTMITGYFSTSQGFEILLLKTNSNGIEEWSQIYGPGRGNGIAATSDGGYIITGVVDDDLILLKTDAQGVEEWRKTFGGTGTEIGYSVQQTSDGGYVCIGSTESFGNGQEDIYLIKTDRNGDVE